MNHGSIKAGWLPYFASEMANQIDQPLVPQPKIVIGHWSRWWVPTSMNTRFLTLEPIAIDRSFIRAADIDWC
jgi:hypothetical protein